ncbi:MULTISPECIES: dienelactone hydrolase family protein [Rhodopseudomonas]|uniref:Dienelactone hydrolase n=1 Tax=Rhodopseudomonas palustris TaxID=1076 RepID=A0A0D7EIS0_RHOPL|nr:MULTISPECIES: dienelactone hydrolase family protein [Rhodopseudomonas]KIZ40420.1 dienelactone hydrolase [Rhodopseudomonas palustris]MDF3808676.1 dienelactone hydrolase family protein [Rhodopseudomonas sp. BAL398]WOK19560.1 dienelactone hydrolase family protein [Rhodopseudomonas sp. BAL398]
MIEPTTLKSQIDGFEFTALHASPGATRRGGIIVLQEVFGLDEAVRGDVARWAGLGFEVIAPSLFDRQERGFVANHDAEGLKIGLRYATENGDDNPISDVQACIDALKRRGPVFLVGYCYGGTITWRAAARTKGLAAASSYYGAGVAASAEMTLSCPIICHFGAKDPYISAEASVIAISSAHPDVPVHVYENSGHGFNNEGPDADPADVRLARERTLKFFEANGND